jgi:hypothetical protein
MAGATGTAKYGDYYWCIKTAEGISEEGEIYVMADRVEVNAHGDLIFYQAAGESLSGSRPEMPTRALAAGQWHVFYAASLFDGAAVAVEHWAGEVRR